MKNLQELWANNPDSSGSTNVAANALWHLNMMAAGDEQPALEFISSAAQLAQRLSLSDDEHHGRPNAYATNAWVIWAAYCEAVFNGHSPAWGKSPPAIPIPDSNPTRDQKPWTPPSRRGPSRATLGVCIFRARCSLAVLTAQVMSMTQSISQGHLDPSDGFQLEQRLKDWHGSLPFALHIQHDATPQHLLLL